MALVRLACIVRLTLPPKGNVTVDHDRREVIVRGSLPHRAEERPLGCAADEDAELEALICC